MFIYDHGRKFLRSRADQVLFVFRYKVGVMPVLSVNSREKYIASSKPVEFAMSVIV